MADTSYVGLHRVCRISRQMLPSLYTVGEVKSKIEKTESEFKAGHNCVKFYRLDGTFSKQTSQSEACSDSPPRRSMSDERCRPQTGCLPA